jgi:hypothetical protein
MVPTTHVTETEIVGTTRIVVKWRHSATRAENTGMSKIELTMNIAKATRNVRPGYAGATGVDTSLLHVRTNRVTKT